MICRSFYFFNLFLFSNAISKLRFKNFLQIPSFSKISVGFYFPSLVSSNDIRIILSFFIMKNMFNFTPFIRRFTKIAFEREGIKYNKLLYLCSISINNIIKFMFFDFFFECIYVFFLFNLASFVTFSYPSFNTFICVFKHSNFIPGINEHFFLYNILFYFKFKFLQNLNLTIKHINKISLNEYYVSQLFTIKPLVNVK